MPRVSDDPRIQEEAGTQVAQHQLAVQDAGLVDRLRAAREQGSLTPGLVHEYADRVRELRDKAGQEVDPSRTAEEQSDQLYDQTTAREQLAALHEAVADQQVPGLQVPDSNLYYDLDHFQPQSEHQELSNKASNLGFLMADENRRKKDTEFSTQPELQDPISLHDALEQGGDSARQAVTEMLGTRRFAEVQELNELWQRASSDETSTYATSQRNFRELIALDQSQAAQDVRRALDMARIDIDDNGRSYRFRLADDDYRR